MRVECASSAERGVGFVDRGVHVMRVDNIVALGKVGEGSIRKSNGMKKLFEQLTVH